jgi:hypothetical protein
MDGHEDRGGDVNARRRRATVMPQDPTITPGHQSGPARIWVADVGGGEEFDAAPGGLIAGVGDRAGTI